VPKQAAQAEVSLSCWIGLLLVLHNRWRSGKGGPVRQFAVGDRVVHPQLGAGTITRLTRLDLSQGHKLHYTIEIPGQASTVYVPKTRVEGGTIRPAVSEARLQRVLQSLRKPPRALSAVAAARQESVLGKLDTCRPQLLAEAVRDLAAHGRRDHLTATDERLLRQGVSMLAAEMALLLDSEPTEVALTIEGTLRDNRVAVEPAGSRGAGGPEKE